MTARSRSSTLSVFKDTDVMNKLIILILACFVLTTGVQNLRAQKIKKLEVAKDSTGFLVRSLLSPSLQKIKFILSSSNNLSAGNRIQFLTYRKVPLSFIFRMSAMLTKLHVDDIDAFEPVPNYIYSRNILEYEFRLKRQKRYPEDFHFYRVDNHSLFNLFD